MMKTKFTQTKNIYDGTMEKTHLYIAFMLVVWAEIDEYLS